MLRPPTLFGHEAAGRIIAVGAGVAGWSVGDRVVANNSAPCFNCFFCRRQEYSLCANLTFNNGTFAQYLKVPAAIVQHNLLPIPEDLPNAIAALTEPLACVLHGVARSSLQPGQRVVVLGDGAIGLMFVGVLAQQGAKVLYLAAMSPACRWANNWGQRKPLTTASSDVPAVVRELTEGMGADIVIEATGIPAVWSWRSPVPVQEQR